MASFGVVYLGWDGLYLDNYAQTRRVDGFMITLTRMDFSFDNAIASSKVEIEMNLKMYDNEGANRWRECNNGCWSDEEKPRAEMCKSLVFNLVVLIKQDASRSRA